MHRYEFGVTQGTFFGRVSVSINVASGAKLNLTNGRKNSTLSFLEQICELAVENIPEIIVEAHKEELRSKLGETRAKDNMFAYADIILREAVLDVHLQKHIKNSDTPFNYAQPVRDDAGRICENARYINPMERANVVNDALFEARIVREAYEKLYPCPNRFMAAIKPAINIMSLGLIPSHPIKSKMTILYQLIALNCDARLDATLDHYAKLNVIQPHEQLPTPEIKTYLHSVGIELVRGYLKR